MGNINKNGKEVHASGNGRWVLVKLNWLSERKRSTMYVKDQRRITDRKDHFVGTSPGLFILKLEINNSHISYCSLSLVGNRLESVRTEIEIKNVLKSRRCEKTERRRGSIDGMGM